MRKKEKKREKKKRKKRNNNNNIYTNTTSMSFTYSNTIISINTPYSHRIIFTTT